MKNIKLTGYENFLLQEALKHFKLIVLKEDFPKNSIITREFVEYTITELEEKLSEHTVSEKIKKLNATA